MWLSNSELAENEKYNTGGQEKKKGKLSFAFRGHRLHIACNTLQPVAHCNSPLSYQKSARSSGCSTGTVALESLTPRLNPLPGTGDKNRGQVMQLCTELQHIKGVMLNEENVKPAEQRG